MIREDVNEIRNVLEKLAERAILEHDFDTLEQIEHANTCLDTVVGLYDFDTLEQIEHANTCLDTVVGLYDELRALNHEHIRMLEERT